MSSRMEKFLGMVNELVNAAMIILVVVFIAVLVHAKLTGGQGMCQREKMTFEDYLLSFPLEQVQL